jgi:hypothetical protein
MRRKKLLILLPLLLALGATGAYAWFSSTGSGSATASTGTLTAPGKPAVPTSGGTVNLSWTEATVSGGGTVNYHVERRDEPGSTWTDVCGSTDAAPITGTSCSDTPGSGTFVYRVTSRYASWHTVGAESDPVAAAVAGTKLVFTTSSQALTAGVTSGTITVEREDASNVPTTAGTTTVNLSSSSGAGIFRNTSDTATISSVAISPGSSSASFKYTDTAAGTPMITAADNAAVLASATQTEAVNAAAASKLVFQVQPSNSTAGQTMSPAVKVEVDDQFGNLTASSANVTVAPSAQTLSGTLTKVAVAGVATFSDLSMTKAGSYTLAASSSGLLGATSSSFTITAAAANKLTYQVQPTNTVAGVAVTPAVKVEIDDQFGNLTASTASVTVAPSAQTLSGTLTKAAVAGVATFSDLSMTKAGSYTLAASSSGLTGATSSSFTITAAAANKLTYQVQPTNTVAGVTITPSVQVEIDDQFGNLTASTASVTVAPSAQTLSGTLTKAAVAGVATFNDLSMTKAGSYTLAASSSGLTGATSGSFTIVAASATKLAITSTAVSGTASTSATLGPITVEREDQFSNPTSLGGAITVNLSSNSAGTAIFSLTSGGSAVASVSIGIGATSANFFYGDTKAGTPTITAASSPLTAATQQETIGVGTTSKLAITSTAVSGTASSSATLGPITVEREDSLGNPTTSGGPLPVSLSSNSTGTALFSATSGGATTATVTIGGGNPSANFFYGDTKAGTPTITGASGSLTSATQVETITGAAATHLVFTTSPQTLTAGVTSGTITVQRLDQFNNPSTSGSTALTLTTTSAGIFRDTSDTFTVSSVTILAGSSTGSFKYNDMTAGGPIITVASGLGSINQTETVNAAAAAKLVFTTGAQTTVVGQTSGTITVQRQDQFSNPTTLPSGAITVGLSSSSTGGVFRNATDTATISGIQITSGATSADLKYKDSLAGSPTLTGSSAGVTDAIQTMTVNKASTTTSLASSANPSVSGQSVTLTATVAAVSPGAGTPTGTVNFKDAGTTISGCGSATLSGGSATCVTSSLTTAAHTITAVYSSDTNFSPSTSANFTQTVNQASTATSLASSPNPSVFGQSVTLTATVAPLAPGAGTPTGTVNFRDNVTTIAGCGTQTLSGGSATCVTSSLAAGSHTTVTAVYSSDVNFSTSTSVNFTQTVSKADQTLSFTSAAPSGAKVAGATYTPTATASSGLTVTLTVDASSSSVCSISSGVVSFAAAGTCVLDANQAGNTNWNAAPQVQQSFTVAKGDQTISFAALANKTFDQGPITVSASASSGLTVSFSSATPSVCTSGGTNGATITFVTVGTCTINANQAGNTNWNAATQVQQTFTVNKGNQTITFNALAAKRLDEGPITISATASSNLAVSFSSATTSICTVSGGTVTLLHVGLCTINANQAGDTNWNAATPVAQTFTVNSGNQTITFNALAPKRLDEGPITVSATASSGLTVTFSSGSATICTVSGTTVTFLTVGTCVIRADQAGGTDWNAATQVSQSFVISKGNQTISFAALLNKRMDESPVTIAATASSGLTVAFSSATTGVCTVSGTTVTLLHVGLCTINANQAGDTNWNAAPQVQQSFTVGKGNQTISFAALSNVRLDQSPVTLTATASSGLTVTYSIANTTNCTVSGSAVTLLHTGTCNVKADQPGDADWNAATTATQGFTIAKGNQTVTFGAAPTEARTGISGSSVSATASSALAVAFGTATSPVCSVGSSTGALTLLTVGLCTITGDQGGSTDWNIAPQATQSFQVYNGTVAGLIFASVTVQNVSQTPSCTGAIGTTYTCNVSGSSMNDTLKASVVFANSSGSATVYSAQNQTISNAYVGKNPGTATVTILANQSTSSTQVQVDRSGNGQAQITVTFTRPGGGTWTAILKTV